jgi:hypothetical protein
VICVDRLEHPVHLVLAVLAVSLEGSRDVGEEGEPARA